MGLQTIGQFAECIRVTSPLLEATWRRQNCGVTSKSDNFLYALIRKEDIARTENYWRYLIIEMQAGQSAARRAFIHEVSEWIDERTGGALSQPDLACQAIEVIQFICDHAFQYDGIESPIEWVNSKIENAIDAFLPQEAYHAEP